jgi:hypothetical protein
MPIWPSWLTELRTAATSAQTAASADADADVAPPDALTVEPALDVLEELEAELPLDPQPAAPPPTATQHAAVATITRHPELGTCTSTEPDQSTAHCS